jgi:hypothetical protein
MRRWRFARGQSRIEDFEMIIGRPAPPPKRNQPINGIEIHRPINGKFQRGRARITAAVGWRGVKLKKLKIKTATAIFKLARLCSLYLGN